MVLWQSIGSFLGHLGSGLDRFDLDGLSGWDGDSYPLKFFGEAAMGRFDAVCFFFGTGRPYRGAVLRRRSDIDNMSPD